MKNMEAVEIVPYQAEHRAAILSVWERSVLATHQFLSPQDFLSIKNIVETIDFSALQVYCLVREEAVLGFIGVSDSKIEMLFLLPEECGKGFGKLLLKFAVMELGADKVDVNEQNLNAAEFYKNAGFEVCERTEFDDQGYPYPLLRMKLKPRSREALTSLSL